MLKKALAVAAVAGALSMLGGTASASTACLDLYIDVNGTVVAQNVCTPD